MISIKGQTSLEFVILTGFMILLFTGMFIIIENRILIAHQDKTRIEAEQLGNLISNEFQMVNKVREGYTREFELPQTINGEKYDVSIENQNEIVISYADLQQVVFLDYAVQGNIGKGENKIFKLNNAGIIVANKEKNYCGNNLVETPNFDELFEECDTSSPNPCSGLQTQCNNCLCQCNISTNCMFQKNCYSNNACSNKINNTKCYNGNWTFDVNCVI